MIVWLGGMAFFHHKIEYGVLYAFISYIRQFFFQPINQITMQWNTFQSTMVSMDRIWNILSTRPEVKDADPKDIADVDLQTVQGKKIDCNSIRFGYSEDRPIIRSSICISVPAK